MGENVKIECRWAHGRFARLMTRSNLVPKSTRRSPAFYFPNSSDRLQAQAYKACLHIGFGDDGINLLVELFDNLRGCALRRTDAVPTASLVARHKSSTVGTPGSASKRVLRVWHHLLLALPLNQHQVRNLFPQTSR
jgi:hypothetical protein